MKNVITVGQLGVSVPIFLADIYPKGCLGNTNILG